MIKIDQDVLCDYCAGMHDRGDDWKSRCEGSNCDDARESYLDDNGLIEVDPESRTFKDLTLGDKIYIIHTDQVVPFIKEKNINSLRQMNGDPLCIHFDSTHVTIKDKNSTVNAERNIFIDKKVCLKVLEKICIERIVQLSKEIGKIST